MNSKTFKKTAIGRCLSGAVTLSLATLISTSAFAQEVQKVPRPESFTKIGSETKVQFQQPDLVEVFVEPSDGKSSFSLLAGIPAFNKYLQMTELRGELKALSGLEVHEKSNLDGMAWAIKNGDVNKVKTLDSVKRLSFIVETKAGLSNSVPWIGAPEVWESVGNGDNNNGEPVTIAVIDSGIDYFHSGFGGSGDVNEFVNNDPNVIEPGSFPTAKVIGGVDFAGADSEAYVFDEDPNGVGSFHGTHVAGIAGGSGAEGVAPGVAPGAELYAVKVFADNGGGSTVSHLGIQWSVDPNQDGDTSDRADVLNLSLGGNYGQLESASTIASDQASAGGSIVVIAAGNSGDIPYIHAAPAVSPKSISVANSVSARLVQVLETVSANAAANGNFPLVEGAHTNTFSSGGSIEGNLVLADSLNGCTPFTNAAEVAGNVALVVRGVCAFDDKYANAEAAGATGLVVYNDGADPTRIAPAGMIGIDPSRQLTGVMISSTDGEALKAALELGQGVATRADIDTKILNDSSLHDTLAASTSRGPGLDNSFKPDVAAPGTGIESVDVGTGTQTTLASGTSMASPHVAGVAALLKQKWPDLAPEGIKAMIQNSTKPAYRDGVAGSSDPYPLTLQGVGRVQVDVASKLTSYASPGGISFGRVNDKWGSHKSQKITVKNLSGQSRVFNITHEPSQTMNGVKVRSYQRRVYVPANGQSTFSIAMDFNPRNAPFDAVGNSQSEVDGWFVLQDRDSEETLRVGYMAIVDPAAGARAFNNYNSVSFYNTGGSPTYAEGFTLAAQSVNEGTSAHDIESFGYRTGVNLFGGAAIDFAFVSKAAWSSHSQLRVQLGIDSDEDGTFETIIEVADHNGTNIPYDGIVDKRIFPGGYNLGQADYDYNDRVMIARYLIDRNGLAPDVGFLDPGDTDFNYIVRTSDINTGRFSDLFGRIDLAEEVSIGANSFVLDQTFNAPLTSELGGDMLWLFQQNQPAEQAQIISVPAAR